MIRAARMTTVAGSMESPQKFLSLRATGSRKCAPDDRLREAIHLSGIRNHGLLRRGVYHRARRRRDPLAPRNDGRDYGRRITRSRDEPATATNAAWACSSG